MAIIPKAIALGSAVGAVGAVVVYGISASPTGSGALVAAKASSLPAVPFPTTTTFVPCKPPAKLVKDVCVTKVAGPTITKVVAPPAGTSSTNSTGGFTPVATPKPSTSTPQTTSSGSTVPGGGDDGPGDD